jgi:NAD(P)H-hydrate epimerase
VLVIGGSQGMTGAVNMAGRAALRTGSGLATVLTPGSCLTAVDVEVPELMVLPGKTGNFGTLCTQHLPLAGMDSVLIGPGMRADYDTCDLTQRLIAEAGVPVVMDADALRHVAGFPEWFTTAKAPRLLTPHPGEMGRLLGKTSKEVQADRVGALELAHRAGGCPVVLKGSRSRVLSQDGGKWLNLNGNPGMGTGGSGDVLAGMAASLAGQGVAPARVLPLAVFLHGKAGDLAKMRKGESGLLAGDLIDAIPAVMRRVQGR